MKLTKNKFLIKTKFLILLLFSIIVFSCQSADNKFIIRFNIDKSYDEEMIRSMFAHTDPAGLTNRAKSMGIPINLANQIRSEQYSKKVQYKIDKLVSNVYSQNAILLSDSVTQYKKLWQPHLKQFAKTLYKLTGHHLYYNEYICVLSHFHPGISSWYGNKIVVRYNYQNEDKLWYVAWEITLSHIFHIVRQYYDRAYIDDWDVWKFAEIATSFILRDNSFRFLFSTHKYNIKDNYFQNSNYPQLKPWEDKLKKQYLKNKDFDTFMKTSISLIRKYH